MKNKDFTPVGIWNGSQGIQYFRWHGAGAADIQLFEESKTFHGRKFHGTTFTFEPFSYFVGYDRNGTLKFDGYEVLFSFLFIFAK